MLGDKHSDNKDLSVQEEEDSKWLLDGLAKDDEKAFEKLYDLYWGNLYEYAYNRLRDKDTSQDVVQDVFLDIWRRRHTLDISNLGAYLRSSVRFKTYKVLSKSPLSVPYFEEFEQVLVSAWLADDPIREKELRKLLDLWIQALPKKRRKIFIMHFMEGLSTADIAQRLGVSRKTVQNQLTTAYADIQKRYIHLLSVMMTLLILK